MKIHREYQQQSAAWMQAHVGVVTASQFDRLLTPQFKIRDGQMPLTFLYQKIAEAWTKCPLPGFGGSWHTEQGNVLEGEAIPWYEFEFNQPIDRVGFIESDCGRFGCSPDGLLGEEGGLEFKCPNADTHVGYLLAGGVPKDYLAQVHGCLYVTGRPWWRFVSYRRHFPALIVDVARDDKIMQLIDEALALFLAKFDSSLAHLRALAPGMEPKAMPTDLGFSNRSDHVFASHDHDVSIP